MTMKTAMAALALIVALAPVPSPALARAQEADLIAAQTCAAIFEAYDSADRQIALLNAQIAAAGDIATQSIYFQQISNWMMDKSNFLQMAQLQHCPLPAGRTFGPVQYERRAARCLLDRQANNPNSRNCDITRWGAE